MRGSLGRSFCAGAAALVLTAGCGAPGGSTNDAGNGNDAANSGDSGGGNPGAGPGIAGCPVFPADNAWNRDVSHDPVDPRSDQYLTSIGLSTGLHPDFGTNPDYGIPYVVVPGTQTPVPVTFDYADESDPGPYPIPPDAPIEGGGTGGDQHVLVIDRDHCLLYEMFGSNPVNNGASWTAGSGAIWHLRENWMRPAGWTSADAAGLPIFPGLVRYDEVAAGEIRHALRFTVVHSQHAYVAPASHFASSNTDPSLPPMGLRVRLKASVDLSSYPLQARVLLRALQVYGMIVADNGSNWFISGTSDSRWSDDDLHTIGQIHGSDFEVIATGPLTTQ